MAYRLEDDLLKKSRPKWGSKRWKRLNAAMNSHSGNRCEFCGKILFNPQSIFIHQGKYCQSKTNRAINI